MLNVTALVQVKAFARQEGLFLALIWFASFLLMVYIPSSSWGFLMALSTPFFVGWRLGHFKTYALDGSISFRRGLAFSWYTFFYATLLFTVLQYVYLRFFDHGALINMLQNSITTLEQAYKAENIQSDPTLTYMKQGMEAMGMLSAIQLAFAFMVQTLFLGTLMSFPIALFCKSAKQRN